MDRGFGANSFQTSIQRQSAITAQLFKATTNMHHIDELFLWLARAIVQSFKVQVTQLWTVQTGRTGQFSVQLRTLASEDPSLPQYSVANEQVAVTVGRILSNRSNYLLYTVAELFPSYQATLLKRYGLNYCSSYFLSSNMLLPPVQDNAPSEAVPTPLVATALLFLKQPLSQSILTTIDLILEQAIAIAEGRKLLLPASPITHSVVELPANPRQQQRSSTASGSLPRLPTITTQQQPDSKLSELVPHRTEDSELMRSSNPLSGAVVISDKQTRRLYTAIDGRRNVEELSNIAGLGRKEVFLALQTLLAQNRIQLYDSSGQLVDSSQFFNGRL